MYVRDCAIEEDFFCDTFDNPDGEEGVRRNEIQCSNAFFQDAKYWNWFPRQVRFAPAALSFVIKTGFLLGHQQPMQVFACLFLFFAWLFCACLLVCNNTLQVNGQTPPPPPLVVQDDFSIPLSLFPPLRCYKDARALLLNKHIFQLNIVIMHCWSVLW